MADWQNWTELLLYCTQVQSVKCIYMVSPFFHEQKISCQMLNRRRSGAAAVSINAALGLISCSSFSGSSFLLLLSPQTDSPGRSKWWQTVSLLLPYSAIFSLSLSLFLLSSHCEAHRPTFPSRRPGLSVALSTRSWTVVYRFSFLLYNIYLLSLFNKATV